MHSFLLTSFLSKTSVLSKYEVLTLLYNLYRHSSKKSCGEYLLFIRKIVLTTIVMLGVSFA